MCTSGVVGLLGSTLITMAMGPVPIRLASSLIVLGGVISIILHTSSVSLVSNSLRWQQGVYQLWAYLVKGVKKYSRSNSSQDCCILIVALATANITQNGVKTCAHIYTV